MKAILVSVSSRNIDKERKIVSNTEQAEAFLKELGLFVNENSLNLLTLAFSKFEKNEIKYYDFDAGDNKFNPSVYLWDVTEEHSQSDLKAIGKKVEKEVAKKYPDLDLRLHTYIQSGNIHSSELRVEGGLRWYKGYVNNTLQNVALPIYELDYKYLNTTFEEVMSDIDEWIARTLDILAETDRMREAGELD